MKKFCLMLLSVALLSAPLFAEDATNDLKVSPWLRYKLTSDFVTDQTWHDFDLSGITIQKKVTDNLGVTVTPGFERKTALDGVTPAGNDTISFAMIEAYFSINDLTKCYGDYGIGLTAGQFITPFYMIEQYYQPFHFIMSPLDFKMMPNNYSELGVMVNKSFLDDMIHTYFGYIAGTGMWNGMLSPANDHPNAGGVLFTTKFAPFKDLNDAVKDLTFTFNLKSIFQAKSRSSYNFLLGYKYQFLAASLEYLKTYSSVRLTDITALSFGVSADIVGPLQALARWDYSDNKSAANVFDHDFLIGVNAKWFDGKLQTALTYDQEYNPQTKTNVAKRIMLATQYSY